MKYTNQIEINQPIEKVIALFDDPENMKHWQSGFISLENISGTPGEPGAKSKLKYKIGKREIEMIETIMVRNLPHEFSGTYEAAGVYNIVKNYFSPIDNNKTKYVSEQEFRFKGMMKIIALLMPGAFRKQTVKLMRDFKNFAESKQ